MSESYRDKFITLRLKHQEVVSQNKILKADNDRKSRELAKIKSTLRALLNAPEI